MLLKSRVQTELQQSNGPQVVVLSRNVPVSKCLKCDQRFQNVTQSYPLTSKLG